MEQLSLFKSPSRWTVADLTRYLRQLLESNEALQNIWVQGEISNLSRPSSGHLYFTLKDSTASLRCVMWRSDVTRLRLALQDGMAVEVHGGIRVYGPQGQYQLQADAIRPLGEGALYQEFLRLKALLEAEGLFDLERKRAIPELPRRIGIVTSTSGAALRDMLNTLRRRYPLADVILAASPVQGDEAPSGLVAALQNLNRVAQPDVILLARGGGSIEDLWAFNDERVVRAIVASEAPVITGVGHETDFTLADFAADLRAPTPSAAAELATPVTILDLQAGLTLSTSRLEVAIYALFDGQRGLLDGRQSSLRFFSPLRRVQTERQRLDDLSRRGNAAQVHRLALEASQLKGLERRLSALNPLAVLSRGYAVVTHKQNDKIVSSASSVKTGEDLNVRVADGNFDVRVTQ
ncbi:MAG: exodeoxyribonuclease VII large subunit [Anaerolineales bacterium]|nr:exodeoxyribonuclease VII large subunit [Anaerolineales bacterium]